MLLITSESGFIDELSSAFKRANDVGERSGVLGSIRIMVVVAINGLISEKHIVGLSRLYRHGVYDQIRAL